MQPLTIPLGIQIHVVKQVESACTSVCKCMLPKSCSDHGKVDKSFCPCVVVVGGETEEG